MTEHVRERMTADEFLAFEGEGDTRYELVGGVVVAMPLENTVHGTIIGNAGGEIDRRLAARPPCRVMARVGIRPDDQNHYIADLVATCAEPVDAAYTQDPFLIAEVLSPSSANEDLGVKLPRYKEQLCVREVWLIDSRQRWVQVWRRNGGEWAVPLPLRGGATFHSDALDDEIALDRLYRNTPL